MEADVDKASTNEITTEAGPYLLDVGDVIAFPQSGWCATVVKATEDGVRLEFIEWLVGMPDHEQIWSWDRIFGWPNDDFIVYGNGYYYHAPIDRVQRATDRRLRERDEKD